MALSAAVTSANAKIDEIASTYSPPAINTPSLRCVDYRRSSEPRVVEACLARPFLPLPVG